MRPRLSLPASTLDLRTVATVEHEQRDDRQLGKVEQLEQNARHSLAKGNPAIVFVLTIQL